VLWRTTERDQGGAPTNGWKRPTGYYITQALIGYRFLIAGGEDTRRGRGWRPTLRWAKRTAKDRITPRVDEPTARVAPDPDERQRGTDPAPLDSQPGWRLEGPATAADPANGGTSVPG